MKEVVKKPSATTTQERKPLLSRSEPFISAAPMSVKAKTEVSKPGDPLEKEANMTADRIMAKSEPGGSSHSTGENSGITSSATTSPESSVVTGGNPMNSATREKMEGAFGTDFSGVKVHTGPEAVSMSRSLGAQAFTYGSDIYFNSGKYDPSTSQGQHLLAHELTHVKQQTGTVQRKINESTNDKIDTTQPVCNEKEAKEKEKFLNTGFFGPRIIKPSTGLGNFWSMYFPHQKNLSIIVLGKAKFVNGLTFNGLIATSDTRGLEKLARFLNLLGDSDLMQKVLSFYTWTSDEKIDSLYDLKYRIEETVKIWQNPGHSLFIDTNCWRDVTATPRFIIHTTETGDAKLNQSGQGIENLQINLVKVPKPEEHRQILSLMKSAIEKRENELKRSLDRPNLSVGASMSTSGKMTLTNVNVEKRPDRIQNWSALSRKMVMFKKDEFSLDEDDKATIKQFKKDFEEADLDKSNSKISIEGHTSKEGSERYNKELAQKRISEVRKEMVNVGIANLEERVSEYNTNIGEAELFDQKHARLFRRVDLFVGKGEMQNTVAHEFGHVFGLDDEYVVKNTSIKGTGYGAGEQVGHSKISEKMKKGKVVAENSDNILSLGNEVRAQHYLTFAEALASLTMKNWKVSG